MESEEANGSEINYMIAMKHVCKFCQKRFPCGRSLGGHMRSHLITNPEKVNTAIDKKKKSQLIPPATTTNTVAGDFSGEGKRVMSQDPNQVKACKECGKAFQSSKALSGHMRSHAVEREKEKEKVRQREKEKENSLLGGGEIEKDPKNQVMDRESDNEGVEVAPKGKSRPRRRTNRRQRYMGATTSATPTTPTTTTTNSSCYNNGGSSSVSEIDQQEQEDVAKCLIMLSRDVGPWGGVVSGEFSDNNSALLEPKTGENRGLRVFKWVGESSCSKDLKDEGFVGDEVLSSGYQRFLEKMKSSELGRNLSSKSVLTQPECANPALSSKRKAKAEPLEAEKRSKFECTTCNKTFHSYQALGGHRASHKKNKGCSPLKPDGSETEETANISVPSHNTLAKADTVEAQKSVQVISKHECPICFKEFSSGQALGGHKRSHLMATSAQLQVESTTSKFISVVEKSNATTTVTTTTTTTTTSSSHEVRDFLDLNLPAPEEEHQQQIVGFKPWWVESTNKHEHLVSLISN